MGISHLPSEGKFNEWPGYNTAMRFRLRTLLILMAIVPPVLAGLVLLLMSPSTRPMVANWITFAVGIAAARWLWVRWPGLVDSAFKR